MERAIPFNVWFSEVESLLDTINKCNFQILDYAEDYMFNNLTISKPQNNIYKFKKAASGEKYNPPAAPQPSLSSSIVTSTFSTYNNTSLAQLTLNSFHVIILCTSERIVKLQVVENWSQNFLSTEKIIHSVVFHDEDLLVNGKWFKINSPEAFTHDLVDDDISVLALIDLFENFRKSA